VAVVALLKDPRHERFEARIDAELFLVEGALFLDHGLQGIEAFDHAGVPFIDFDNQGRQPTHQIVEGIVIHKSFLLAHCRGLAGPRALLGGRGVIAQAGQVVERAAQGTAAAVDGICLDVEAFPILDVRDPTLRDVHQCRDFLLAQLSRLAALPYSVSQYFQIQSLYGWHRHPPL